MDIEFAGQTPDSAESRAGGAARGITLIQAAVHVTHTAAAVDGEQLNGLPGAGLERLHQQFAAPAMPNQIGRQLRRGDRDPPGQRGIETIGHRQALGIPARLSYLAVVLDHVSSLLPAMLHYHLQLQRTMVTFVPLAGEDSISKSLTSRRAPDSPSP